MKKRHYLILAMLLALALILTSCIPGINGTDNPPSGEGDKKITVFSPTVPVNIVTSASADESVTDASGRLAAAISELGVEVSSTLDMYTVSGSKIVVGNTIEPATKTCVADIEAMKLSEDEEAFVIRTSGGVLTIYASDSACYGKAIDYFVANYLNSSTLELEDDKLLYSEKIPHSELEGDDSQLVWAERWSRVEAEFGTDIAYSLKTLYSFYGDSVYKWIANLYDIENGGFYYSNSARDYEGFLPDIESTTQALWLITATGLTSHLGNDLTAALPEDVVEQTLQFVYSLYDESDGYFYHEQWGKDIGSSRKGRDINSALDVIRKLGGTPPENHALNRLEGGVAQAVSKVVATSSVKPVGFLSSQKELLDWLESLNINTDSHSAGHTIESVSSQISAAGYGEFVLDWLDSKQLESGLWQTVDPKNPYMALSGLLKIGSCYNKLDRLMKRCENMVDTAIDVILSDVDPAIVIYVYNPWGGLKYALNNMSAANNEAKANGNPLPYDYDAAFSRVLEKFPDMIDVTIDKLSLFQKSDGSFSYYQGVSAAYTQGTHVSLGVKEGDVNGTSLGMTTMFTTLYEILKVPTVPLYNEDDYNEFIEELTGLEAVEKLPAPSFETIDFDDGEMPVHISPYSTKNGSEMGVRDDGEGNNALMVHSVSGIGNQMTFKAPESTEGCVSFAFDFDMRLDRASGRTHQFSLLSSAGSLAYMITLNTSGDVITFKDTTSNMHDKDSVTFTKTATVGEWCHLRIEYHVLTDGSSVTVLYVNDEYAGESRNFYGKYNANGELVDGAVPKTNVERLQLFSMVGSDTLIYYDNFYYEFYTESEYEER